MPRKFVLPKKTRAESIEDESDAALDAQVGTVLDAPYSDADETVDDDDDDDDDDDVDNDEDAADDDAPVGEPDATGQLPLVQEAAPTTKLITALKLDTPEQVRSVALSINARIADLKALAKKNRDLGKETEAKAIEREVLMIRETLTPQLKSQGALAFNEGETLPQAVSRIFQSEFRQRVRTAITKTVSMRAGEKPEDARLRQLDKLTEFEALIGNIGEIGGMLVVSWLTQVADRAYEKGKVAHGAAPSDIARETLQAIEIALQGRDE
jgi:hypothetical protein